MTQTLYAGTPGPLKLQPEQYRRLLEPIHPNRVRKLSGNDYVEAWDIRRQLTRVFGFGGWSFEALETTCASERSVPNGDRFKHTVVYRVIGRLTVYGAEGTYAFYDDASTGEAVNQPSLGDAHDLAIKAALSGALKRCAVNLGDLFGLSLYDKGKADAVIVGTFLPPDGLSGTGAPLDGETPQSAMGALPDTVDGGELDEQANAQERATDTADLNRRAKENRPEPIEGAANTPADADAQLAERIATAAKNVLGQANQANMTTGGIEALVANTNPGILDAPAIPGDENSPTVREALKARWHEVNGANVRPVPA